MRYLFLLVLTIALFAVMTADANAIGRRGNCASCQNGQCAAPPSVLSPTAAKTCAPGCECASGGKCTCGPNCPNCAHGHASGDACHERSGFMSRGPVRRGVRGLFGRVFGCRGC